MVKNSNKKDQKTYRELLRERLIHLTPLDPESARFQYYLEYDLKAVERGKDTANTLKRFLNLEGSNILDLGCGTGGHAIAFSHEGAHTVGLDPDKTVCHLALIRTREMRMSVDFVVGDGSASPLRDSSFHLIICNHVFTKKFELRRSSKDSKRETSTATLLCRFCLLSNYFSW